MIKDSYALGNEILRLWQRHCYKNSGELSKKLLMMPVYVKIENQCVPVTNVVFNDDNENPGIIIEIDRKSYDI